MSDDLRITKHAGQRGRKRLHWSKAALERMAPRVLKDGLSLPEANGTNVWVIESRECGPFDDEEEE